MNHKISPRLNNKLCIVTPLYRETLTDAEWLSIRLGEKKVHQLNKVGLHYRIKEESRNSNLRNSETQMQQSLAYIYSKHQKLFEEIWGNPIELLREYERLKSDNKRYLLLLNSPLIRIALKLGIWIKEKRSKH
jgi:hypothetical protein